MRQESGLHTKKRENCDRPEPQRQRRSSKQNRVRRRVTREDRRTKCGAACGRAAEAAGCRELRHELAMQRLRRHGRAPLLLSDTLKDTGALFVCAEALEWRRWGSFFPLGKAASNAASTAIFEMAISRLEAEPSPGCASSSAVGVRTLRR